jgi:cobalt-zinc-cadmium efflux system outer membrane protein
MRVAWWTAVAAVAVVLGVAQPVAAQALTLTDAIARARTRAPDVIAALARVDEARGRRLGVTARLRDNPVLDGDLGPRRGSGQQTWDYAVGVSQLFETGGQRGARITAADADIALTQASAEETARLVTREVALAYTRAAAARDRIRLLTAAEAIAEDLRTATERRYQVGDVAALDVNLTTIAAARARAERVGAESDQSEALRPLRLLLGLDARSDVTLVDGIERLPAAEPVLMAAIVQAPAIRQLDAELAQARADLDLGRGMSRPDLVPRLSFSRERDERILLGGVSIALPVFDRGVGRTAEADARIRRLTLERAAILRRLEFDVTAGLAAYERRKRAADQLAANALPAAADNESLAGRSLDAGEINLLNFLLVRQDVLSTRLAYVDAQMDAALAAIEIDAAAGVLR